MTLVVILEVLGVIALVVVTFVLVRAARVLNRVNRPTWTSMTTPASVETKDVPPSP